MSEGCRISHWARVAVSVEAIEQWQRDQSQKNGSSTVTATDFGPGRRSVKAGLLYPLFGQCCSGRARRP